MKPDISIGAIRPSPEGTNSYLFRRAVCRPDEQSNVRFVCSGPATDRYVEGVEARFISMGSYRGFPSTAEFVECLSDSGPLPLPKGPLLLPERWKTMAEKEEVRYERLHNQHILPQNENLSIHWQSDLGEQWQEVQGSTFTLFLGTSRSRDITLNTQTVHSMQNGISKAVSKQSPLIEA